MDFESNAPTYPDRSGRAAALMPKVVTHGAPTPAGWLPRVNNWVDVVGRVGKLCARGAQPLINLEEKRIGGAKAQTTRGS